MRISCQVIFVDGKPNRNNRIYTNEAVENILNTWKDHTDIIFGMFDALEYHLKDVCGKITNVYLDGDTVVVEGELFDDHNGTKILKQLKEVGLNMYITTSGTGDLAEDNKTVKDFQLHHFILSNDSAFEVSGIEEL